MSPFDFVTDINLDKKDIMTNSDNPELAQKTYNPYLTNRALSYFPDTIDLANFMNMYPDLDNKMQYDFLLNSVRKRKRFSKWHKSSEDENLPIVMDYYGYSVNQAKEVIRILDDEQINFIKQKMDKGGMK